MAHLRVCHNDNWFYRWDRFEWTEEYKGFSQSVSRCKRKYFRVIIFSGLFSRRLYYCLVHWGWCANWYIGCKWLSRRICWIASKCFEGTSSKQANPIPFYQKVWCHLPEAEEKAGWTTCTGTWDQTHCGEMTLHNGSGRFRRVCTHRVNVRLLTPTLSSSPGSETTVKIFKALFYMSAIEKEKRRALTSHIAHHS